MPLPGSCHPRAIELMNSAVPGLESTGGLLLAATSIAVHARPATRVEEVERTISAYVDAVHARIPRLKRAARPIPPEDVEVVMAHLHFVLFEQAGFTGNAAEYYDERNNYLPDVLVRRLGVPITLALVYKAVGELLGLTVHGINAPMHFLIEVEGPGRRMFVDPFNGGRLLWEDEVAAAILETTGVSVDPGRLPRASHQAWLARIIRNLEALFANAGRQDDVRAMQELAAIAGVHEY